MAIINIFQFPISGEWISYNSNNEQWCVNHRDGRIITFEDYNDCVFLLPILEYSYNDAIYIIKQNIVDNNLSLNILNSFPFEKIVKRALFYSTEHWPQHALQWIEEWIEEGFLLDEECISLLESIYIDNTRTQKFRHRIKRLLKKI